MSGIAGAYQLNAIPLAHHVLTKMVQAMRHRAVDGRDVWQQGAMGLGHCSLHTTPSSAFHPQPHWNATYTHLITADVRLDNRDQLFGALVISGLSTQKTSDSQLILAAYERWGDRCVNYLKGDFAFVIWDQRQQMLFCARDRVGVKPFYYVYYPGHVFGFASEIKALWEIPDVSRDLNEPRIGEYLISVFADPQTTFYENIYRLSPGYTLTVSPDSFRLHSYWQLNPTLETHLPSDQAYAEHFRALFLQAVERRLQSSVNVGSLLSGGLDSSTITCAARFLRQQQGHEQPLPTFSAVFPDIQSCDESPYIDAALAGGGLQPFYIQADRLSPLTDHPDQFLGQLEEPHYAFNLYINWYLCAIAQSQNVRVILDGFDGDSTVSHGRGYLPELAYNGRWLAIAQELRGFCQHTQRPYWPTVWRYVRQYGLIPRLPPLLQHALRSPPDKTEEVPSWVAGLNPDFVKRIGLVERWQESVRSQQHDLKHRSKAEHYYHLTRPLMPYTLEALDKAAAYFGIELRLPFWDQDLVEFCYSLPPHQKIHHGWTRWVMRRGMVGILPDSIQWRVDKSNLSPGFAHVFRTFERSRLQDTLANLSESCQDYINMAAWRQAQEQFLSGSPVSAQSMLTTWRSFNLALWLQFR